MALSLPPIPPVLKPIQHYLKIATEHETRDPVVSYWSRIYALQAGLKIDRKSKESLLFLTALMDWLEMRKKELSTEEAITSEMVAQAHIENYALKLFLWADSEDRAAKFNKNVVKAFYTAGLLFDVLTTFGEINDEIAHHRKYAKWKAAYIHNCLKNGETPVPGPMGGEGEGEGFGENEAAGGAADWSENPPHSSYEDFNSPSTSGLNPMNNSQTGLYPPSAGVHAPPSTPSEQPTTPTPSMTQYIQYDDFKPPPHPDGVQLTAEDFTKAQKYCKWAGSALQYEDASTAIENLQKALKLLTTGQDS